MNNKDLHDAIGEINTSLIADVAEARKTAKSRRFSIALKYISVAACVCLVVLVSVIVGMGIFKGSEPDANIPAEYTVETSANTTAPSVNDNAVTKEPVRDINETSPNSVKNDVADEPAEDMFVPANSNDLTSGVMADKLSNNSTNPADFSITVADFSFELFRNTMTGEGNEMLSPLSALYALTMCANSVEGESLRQIENAVGMSRDEMNSFVRSYMDSLPNGRGYSLKCANSLWLRDSENLTVSDEYLRNVKEYLSAQVYTSPFDTSTLDDINSWVKENTNGMIDGMLDEIDPSEHLYLLNAVTFDAEWNTPLTEIPVESLFTLADGTEIKFGNYMLGNCYDGYLEDDDTTGFIYNYKNNSFAFVALLPNEGISISDYVSSLTGEKVYSLLQNKQLVKTDISLHAFRSEYSGYLDEPLKSLGITDLFDPFKINMSGFKHSEQPLYYSSTMQKTFIEVDIFGTKASSSTRSPGLAMSIPDKRVNLCRPYVYMIIDCENGIPLFLGTVMDPTN